MFDEEVKWFSQTLLTYKDNQYGSDGYLRIAISTNTKDYKTFNPPNFSISISNSYLKAYNINHPQAIDLLKAFELSLQNMNGEELEIQRKSSKNVVLHFKIVPKDQLVVIQIISNETDFTKVLIPFNLVFESFARSLRYFVENYFKLCSDLFMKSINSNLYITADQLPGLIKGISSQIISGYNLDSGAQMSAPAPVTEKTIDDLDSFLGEDMKNIKVPEIEQEKAQEVKPIEIDSKFVTRVIDNDLYNLELMLNNASLSSMSYITIADEIKNRLDIKRDQFTMLPELLEDEMKSLGYISRLFYLMTYHNNMVNEVPIPSSIPVFKYEKTVPGDVIDIALDLFLFGGYVRILRRRLEDKISNIVDNKSLFYLQYRCFLDPIIFSFIENVPSEPLESTIISRYRYYNEQLKIFHRYTTLLTDNGCPLITENDISHYVREVQDKVIGKAPYILQLHQSFDLRLPTKNQFSLEQIVNEAIHLELAEKEGKDLKDKFILEKIKEQFPISDEVLSFFLKKKTKTTQPKVVKESNLSRFVKFFESDVPEACRDDFKEFIKKTGNKNFNFSECSFSLEEFDENIIKGLYNWKPEDDVKISQNYTYFFERFENEIMTKESILSSATKQVEDMGGWDILSEGV